MDDPKTAQRKKLDEICGKSPFLTLLEDSHVTMLTFGGKQTWIAKKDEDFHYSFIYTQNESYTVVQAGLNFYIFESKKIRIDPQSNAQ